MTDGSVIPPSNRSPLKLSFLAPPVGYYAIFFIAPLAFLVVLGFWIVRDYQIVAEFSVGNYIDIFSQFFSRSRFGWALIQSIYVAVTTSVFAVIFCYFLAMGIVFCVPERYQRLFLVLAILPFWSSYILRLFAWQLILAQKGVLNYVLGGLGLDDPLIITNTQIGTRIGLIHYLSPILIIILYITLINVNRNLIEAARELGATRLQAFWRVIVPLSRLGLTFAFGFGVIVSFGDVLSGMLVGGWLLAFTFSFDEFIIAWFVSGFDQTLPVAVYNVMIASHDPSLNAIGTIVFGLLLLTLLGAELLIIPLFMRRRTAR